MKGVPRLAPPIAIALLAVAVLLLPSTMIMAGTALVVIAILLIAPPVIALGLHFVLVQVAGEALHVGPLPLGVAQGFYVIVVAAALRRAAASSPRLRGPIDRSMAAFGLVVAVAVGVGVVSGSELAMVRADATPIVFLMMSYVASRLIVRTLPDVDVVLACILAGSALAALKGIYLFLTPLTVEWDGVWQARRIVEFGIVRVILRGADVLFVVSTIVVAARWWYGRRVSWLSGASGALSAVGVLLSATRSNWAGLAGGLAWLGAIQLAFSKATIRRAVLAGLLATVVLIVALTASETARSVGEAGVAFVAGRLHTVDFRRIESLAVLDAAWQTYGLGAGFGAMYEYWDIVKGVVVRTSWSHNGYLEIFLKTGVLGLLVFLSLFWQSFRLTVDGVRRGHPWADRLLGVQGGVAAILVLSLTTNKFFELSGPMFLGFAFAVVQAAADAERA